MKVIVTGAAGFIGSHLVERLLMNGHKVVGADNLSRRGAISNLQFIEKLDGDFRCEHIDIRCRGDVDRVVAANDDADALFHEAAQVAVTTSAVRPREDFEVNALGTFNVLEAIRERAPSMRMVHASTNKVYGNMSDTGVREGASRYSYAAGGQGIGEEQPLDFHSPYGCSKGAADQYVRDYSRIYGLKATVLRQSCIYGTRQFGMEDQGWVAWMCICAARGRKISVFGDGKQVRDLLWIDDLVDLYIRVISAGDIGAGEIYNAGGGGSRTLSILELLGMLEGLLGRKVEREFHSWRPGDQKIFVADCRKAEEQLGWRAKVDPTAGVKRLLDWVVVNRAMLDGMLGGDGV